MPYADLHCHPFLRPYQRLKNDTDLMSVHPGERTSVWHLEAPHSKLTNIELELGFISYTQSDFTNVCNSDGAGLVIAGLYAVESGFFQLPNKKILSILLNIAGVKDLAEDIIGAWITRYESGRVDFVKSDDYDYFQDLIKQIRFALNPPAFTADLSQADLGIYNAIKDKSYDVLKPGNNADINNNIVKVVLTVEGGNCLWSNVSFKKQAWNGRDFKNKSIRNEIADYKALDVNNYREAMTPAIIDNARQEMAKLIPWTVCDSVIKNVQFLKNLKARPFFITLAHHFYNGICGHARSLQPLKNMVDQDLGCNADISNLGWMVINEMLKEKNKRIFIDVKHMSLASRLSYYTFRRNHYPDVPVIYSHAAVYCGRLAVAGDEHSGFVNSTDAREDKFYKQDINLLDDDIIEIVKSNGIFGLELDQRVNGIVGDHKNEVLPDMLWHNMRYVAEVITKQPLDTGRTAWDFISLGTDFDGVINPYKEYGLFCDMPSLREFIKGFLVPYLAGTNRLSARDRSPDAETILDKIFFSNIVDFVNRYYV